VTLTFWPQLFLGVIAFATLTMALIQVGLGVGAWLIARRVAGLIQQIERELKPLTENVNAMARDAARATSLATAQVERVDRLFTELTARVEQPADAIQRAILSPLRDGAAMISGLKAAIQAFRELTNRPRRSKEVEKPADDSSIR
jgi:hypothetical protein